MVFSLSVQAALVLVAISVIRNEPQALTPPPSPGSPTLLAQVGSSTSRIRRARRQTLDGHSQPNIDNKLLCGQILPSVKDGKTSPQIGGWENLTSAEDRKLQLL